MYFRIPAALTILLICLLMGATALGQTYTISGYIKDKTNGEELIGANVYVKELNNGTVSNAYGFYSLSLKKGSYTLRYSFMGYAPQTLKVNLDTAKKINVKLNPQEQEIEEVEVTAEKKDANVTRNQMSVEKLQVKTIRKLPAFMGEVDVIKAIQLLPGVQSASEGSSGFSVRGGGVDQNLILLDEATVYNASHLLGFFSVFNNDAIQNVELYKGDIPAKYGGRLSSVLDIRMKNGNNKTFSGTGGISNISSRLTLEGPLGSEKTSYLLSGRRTYFDLFIPLLPNDDLEGNRLFFYDLNAKINHRINKKNRIYLSGYSGRDFFKNDFADFGFGNQTGTLRWNHLFSDKLFANVTLLYSRYNYELGSSIDGQGGFSWRSGLKDWSAQVDFNYYLSPSQSLNFGGATKIHSFNPGIIESTGEENLFEQFKIPGSNALEHEAYISSKSEVGNFTFKYGLRLSAFQNMGKSKVYDYDANYNAINSSLYKKGEIYHTYWNLAPRLGIKYMLNKVSSLKASYSRTNQYVQIAQNSTAGTPLDIWFPASPNVEPQIADQIALGYFRNFYRNRLETSVEVYYKNMQQIIDFKDHANLLLNKKLDGELRFGEGMAYGAEFMLRMNYPRLNGWVSYTYSHTQRTVSAINDGEPYVAPHDKPHSISAVLSYKLGNQLTAASTWVYATGQPVTFPTGRYEYNGKLVPVYSDRNDYRMPDYHRLDFSLTWEGKQNPKRKWHSEWNLSVYNAYNRKNAWAINFVQDKNNPKQTYAEKTYLFSIIPALTYNFKF